MNKKLRNVSRISLLFLLSVVLLSGCFSGNGGNKKVNESSSGSNAVSGDTTGTDPKSGFNLETANVITPKVLGNLPYGDASRRPVEDVLTQIWRDKTKVVPERVLVPEGQSNIQYFQMQSIAGTMPEVIGVENGIVDSTEVFDYLKQQNLVQEITLDDIYAYMPLTVKRLEGWDISVEDWYKANLDFKSQKLYHIPGTPTQILRPPVEGLARDTNAYSYSYEPYTWYFRDDILKRIFPPSQIGRGTTRTLYQKRGISKL